MIDTVDAQFAWRLPLEANAEALVAAFLSWLAARVEAPPHEVNAAAVIRGQEVAFAGPRTGLTFRYRGLEQPWRADRHNVLVRSFLSAIRAQDASVQPGFVVKTGTSDMNVVGPLWRCPIVAYGPGDSALDHTPHEHLSLDEYWRAIQVVEEMLRCFADAHSS